MRLPGHKGEGPFLFFAKPFSKSSSQQETKTGFSVNSTQCYCLKASINQPSCRLSALSIVVVRLVSFLVLPEVKALVALPLPRPIVASFILVCHALRAYFGSTKSRHRRGRRASTFLWIWYWKSHRMMVLADDSDKCNNSKKKNAPRWIDCGTSWYENIRIMSQRRIGHPGPLLANVQSCEAFKVIWL